MQLKELKLWNKFHNTPDQRFFEYLKKHKDIDKAIIDAKATMGDIAVPVPTAQQATPTNKKEKLVSQHRWNFIKRKAMPLPHKTHDLEPDIIYTGRPPVVAASPKSYEDDERLSYRMVNMENVDQLLWITQDRGGFGTPGRDGPINDWQQNVKKIMEHSFGRGVVIQAGGNCGMYARFYNKYFNNVHTVEPEELNFKCLNHNTKDFKNINAYNAALGDKEGFVKISGGGYRNCGTFRVREIKEDDVSIPMITIDSMSLPHVDLIHLDLEGFEEKALKGAIETIKKFKPTIITERNRGNTFLREMGYTEVKLPKMDTLFFHPDTRKKSREAEKNSKKVLIIGSGHSATKVQKMNTDDVKVVTVNNAWQVSDKWDINIHAPDHPRDKRPSNHPSEKKVFSSGGAHGYISSVQRHGGLTKCGFSITLASAYWVLENLHPTDIGFLGCDMNYEPQDGKTAFYGVGVDIKRRNEPDPDRMAKRYGPNDPQKYLHDIYRRFFDIAKSKGVNVWNASGEKDSRLPFPMKEDFI
jgi:FkbM family methyltransferase